MATVFAREPLERLRFVVQTGGKSPKVTGSYSGLESMMMMAFYNGQIELTPKGRCLVFGIEDNRYLGYIARNEHDFPERHKPEPEDENTYFADWYEEAQ